MRERMSKLINKWTVVMMVVLLVAAVWVIPAKAETATYGVLTYTYDISKGQATIIDCDESVSGELEIPAQIDGYKVVGIDSYAFQACKELTSIKIPEGVKTIGQRAFDRCSALTSVDIPSTITNIAYGAFGNLTNLETVYMADLASWCKADIGGSGANPLEYAENLYVKGVKTEGTLEIPYGVKNINKYAFFGCSIFSNVQIPSTVKSIGESAFSLCNSLINVEIPSSVNQIDNSAFYKCTQLEHVKITSDVTTFGEEAFYMCDKLKSVEVSGSKSLKNYGFVIANIQKITITEGTTSICTRAFEGCSNLEEVSVPSSVTSIGLGAFNNCNNLKKVNIVDLNAWCEITFPGSSSNPLYYAKNLFLNGKKLEGAIEIAEGIENIGNYAFYYCDGITSVTIPSSVAYIGVNAFEGCNGLKSVNIPSGVTQIFDSTFKDCSSLTDIELSSTITEISTNAFSGCGSLSRVVLPSGLTQIGRSAFANCSSLLDMKIPEGVEILEEGTFKGCTSMTSIELPIGLTQIGDSVFFDCSNLISVELPSGLSEMGVTVFANCSSLISVQLPDKLTQIGNSTFANCSALQSIEIPDGVTTIGYYAFENCSSLKNVKIPSRVSIIEGYAFRGCSSLSTIEIPPALTKSSGDAFASCNNIDGVYITDLVAWCQIQFVDETSNPLHCGADLYLNGELLADKVVMPSTLDEICDYAFVGCKSIISVKIPSNIKYINKSVFSKCINLIDVRIESGTRYIFNNAFSNCPSLSVIYIPSTVGSGGIAANAFDNTNVTIHVYEESHYAYKYATQNDISVVVIPKELKVEAKTEYCLGEEWDDDQFALTLAYIDGIEISSIVEGFVITGFDSTVLGKQSVQVEYDTYKTTLDVTILEHVYGENSNNVCSRCGQEQIVTCVEIAKEPDKAIYYVGQTLDTKGLTLKLTYSDGTTEMVTTGYAISGFNSSVAGSKEITVSYEGFSVSFHVTVLSPSIEISKKEISIVVGYSETLEARTTPEAGGVTWVSSNPNIATVADGRVQGMASGETTILAQFTYNGIVYESVCTVKVKKIEVTKVSIETLPKKTAYYLNDKIDSTGLTLKVAYSDGTTKVVNEGFLVSADMSTTVTDKVIVKYEQYELSYNITINTPSIVISNEKLSIPMGRSFMLGVETTPSEQTISWSSSNTQIVGVTDGQVFGLAEGTAYVTASFTYNGIVYTDICPIEIYEFKATDLEILQLPYKTEYCMGEEYDLSGLVLRVLFNDGTTEETESDYEICGVDSEQPGYCTIYIECQGLTTSFDVVIHEYETIWSADETNHWYKCVICKHKKDLAQHKFDNDLDKICNICGYEREHVKPEKLEIVKMPTKSEYRLGEEYNLEGLILKATYSDGTTEIITSEYQIDGMDSDKEGIQTIWVVYYGVNAEIDLIVHDYETEWSVDKTSHWHDCKLCDSKTDVGTHNFGNWQVVTPATTTSEGLEKHSCTTCGHEETRPIAKLPSGTWKQDGTGWWYQNANGTYPANCWKEIDNVWYYFNASGYILTGWQSINGTWYYFNGSGAMLTGWQSIGGTWYYFNGSGAMVTGWQLLGGTWYYFNGSGAMATGWQSLGGTWYYFNGSGAMATGWQSLGGTWYYFNAGGAMVTGWQQIDDAWYYFEGSGAMVANRWVGNYYLQADGSMATNMWIGSYYVGADGVWVP